MKTEIKVTELTKDELSSILSDALYGSDWLGADYDSELKGDFENPDECFEDKLADILLHGHPILLVDLEQSTDDSEEELYGEKGLLTENDGWNTDCKYVAVYGITLDDILKACSTQEGYGLVHDILVDECGDYFTANSLLQIAMFGEVIYG